MKNIFMLFLIIDHESYDSQYGSIHDSKIKLSDSRFKSRFDNHDHTYNKSKTLIQVKQSSNSNLNYNAVANSQSLLQSALEQLNKKI